MPLPVRQQSITPFQQYLQDTMLADTGAGGLATLLADPDAVFVNRPPELVGGVRRALPYILISNATEVGNKYVFHRIANDGTQQIDCFTPERETTLALGAIYNRFLFLFDNKRPAVPGFVAYKATEVEFQGSPEDALGTHGIWVVSAFLRMP